MWRDSLTNRQAEILELIAESVQTKGFAPSIREIADAFGINSPNGVVCHLKALERKGFLIRQKSKSRAIELTAYFLEQIKGLPLKGQVAAGDLHESSKPGQRVDFGALFEVEGGFALKIRGDSMIDANITDGDYVVVTPQDSAKPGQIVVAQTPQGKTTIKYWFPEGNRIRLQPANKKMEPTFATDVKVLGVITGVVRKLA